VLDLSVDSCSYLRVKFVPGDGDVYISASQIHRFNLRAGDMVGGQARAKIRTVFWFAQSRKKSTVSPLKSEDALIWRSYPIYPESQINWKPAKFPSDALD
jgi:transcription termination factor Rho